MSKQRVEDLFPSSFGRKKADESIDALDPSLSMTAFLDAWEQAYFDAVGASPFRKRPKLRE